MFIKQVAQVSSKTIEHVIDINTRRNQTALSIYIPQKTQSDENLISMSITIGCTPDRFSSERPETAELKKDDLLQSSSPTPTSASNFNTSMSPLTPAQVHKAAERTNLQALNRPPRIQVRKLMFRLFHHLY